MAFFVTKSMPHIFSTPDNKLHSSSSLRPTVDSLMLRKSDTPLIAAALDRQFSSDWELQLYSDILKLFQNSMLDESVPVGTVALLELLSEIYNMGRLLDGEQSKLILPPYPHEDYFSYFIAAFILSYRLLSKDKPVEDGFWERVMTKSGIIIVDDVVKLSVDLQTLLEVNTKYYPPPPISSTDPAFKFYYSGDLPVPPNDFIPRLRYLKTKSTMYAHICTLMTLRGEDVLKIDPRGKWKKDMALQFPPCYGYMLNKFVLFEDTRLKAPGLNSASSDKEVYDYLMTQNRKKVEKGKPGTVGLGLGVTVV